MLVLFSQTKYDALWEEIKKPVNMDIMLPGYLDVVPSMSISQVVNQLELLPGKDFLEDPNKSFVIHKNQNCTGQWLKMNLSG